MGEPASYFVAVPRHNSGGRANGRPPVRGRPAVRESTAPGPGWGRRTSSVGYRGPAAFTASDTWSSNFRKFSLNIPTSFSAWAS